MARETVNVGDRLVAAAAAPLNNLAAFTWAGWMYADSTGLSTTQAHIIAKSEVLGGTLSISKRIRLSSNRSMQATVLRVEEAATAQTPGNVVTLAAWCHFVLTYSEADGLRMYLNGSECSYVSRDVGSGNTESDDASDLILLNAADGSRTFDGRLAEVGVWNRVLSSAEINVLASRKHAPMLVRSGLVGAWRLLGAASPEPDAINGNSATVYGAVSSGHPPGMIAALPERAMRMGMMRGMMKRAG